MSQSLNHFKLVSWTCTKMAPTVTRSQPNRASLGCGGTGALCLGCASHKSPSTARSYKYWPTFLKNAFSTLLNQCHVELKQFWMQKGGSNTVLVWSS